MSYTITRVGSNIVLKYGDDIHSMWKTSEFNVHVNDLDDDNRVFIGHDNFNVKLEYSLCTSPSGATSKYDFVDKLTHITDITNSTELDLCDGTLGDKVSSKFLGRNISIGTDEEDIWIVGGDYNFLTGATTIEVISKNAEDDSTGLGSRSVIIYGLDESCIEITEVIALTGNGTVTTTNSFLRIHNCYVATCGTNRGSNYNDIDFQSTGSNLMVARISGSGTINTSGYGCGRTQLGIYTVPADKTLYITSVYVNIDSDKRANMALYTVANIDNVTPPTSPKIEIIKLDYIKNYREKVLKSYMT